MTWSQRIQEVDERQANVLIDDRFSSQAPIEALPRLAWFGVYARLDPGDAFWHPDETETLDSIESDLIDLCETFGRGWVVYVLRIDTRGIREYYFYNGKDATLENVLPSLQEAHPNYKIEFDEKYDADWETYFRFLA